MKKVSLITFIICACCWTAIAQQTSAVVTGGIGWKRIAAVTPLTGRGFGRISLYTVGGSIVPVMSSISWYHDWSLEAGISIHSDSKMSPYWSEFRITDEADITYIEVNFTQDIANLVLLSDDYGWNLAVLYSGTLPDGGGVVRATASAGRINIENNFVVDYGGNVGIGTATPQAKLAVNGNILAKEIKIKGDISVPDYVFSDDYELATLKEIEVYINQHKHLPEIPSAADIQRDGLDLTKMNMLLLKKMEELTLYIIQQQKTIDVLVDKTKEL